MKTLNLKKCQIGLDKKCKSWRGLEKKCFSKRQMTKIVDKMLNVASNVVSNVSFIVPDEDNDYIDTSTPLTKSYNRNK